MYYHDDNTWARGRKGFYDVRGNRVTKTHDSDGDATAEEIIEYTYNDWNQMTEMLVDKDASDTDTNGDEKYTYTYNDNGAVDLEQKSEYATSWSAAADYVDYTYNVLGQLTDFDNKVAGATDCSYKYDVLGRRIEATIGSTTEHYFYDGNDVIADFDQTDSGALCKRYLTPGLDENMIVWDVANSETGYFFHDGLGSVRNLLDSSGAKIVTYDYTAFGETTTTNGAGHYEGFTNRYQYTGREKDLSDHYYYRARYYRPSQGRFGSTDPVVHSNLYSYTNNPIQYIDPLGTDFIAIADRAVGGVLPFWHYSLQYWCCPNKFRPLNYTDGFSEEEIQAKCENKGEKLGAVELQKKTDWVVWVGVQAVDAELYHHGIFKAGIKYYAQKNVHISYIKYSDEGANIMPIFDDTKKATQEKWTEIINIAKEYKWAEQEGFDDDEANPVFKQWPRSLYKALQTNSNTFVRYVVRKSGLTMVEMDGGHPGNDTPSQNTDEDWLTRLLYVFESYHKPWKSGQTEPPKPSPSFKETDRMRPVG